MLKCLPKFLQNTIMNVANGIPPVSVLQKCSPELSPILTKLYKNVMLSPAFHLAGKFLQFIPVFKNSGEPSDNSNCLPSAFYQPWSKSLLINSSLVSHVERNNLLSDHQCGLCSKRSIADLFTAITERIHQSLDMSGIALDISKAFDKVWHAGLLKA